MSSTPATSVKKSLLQGCLTVIILELSELLAWAQLFDKIEGCALHGCRVIKTLTHYRLFSQKKTFFIFLKIASFQYFFQKESKINSFYSKVAVWKLLAYDFTERNSIKKVFLRVFQTFAIIFRNISICSQEANYMKDKLGIKPGKRDDSSVFCRVLFNIKHIC